MKKSKLIQDKQLGEHQNDLNLKKREMNIWEKLTVVSPILSIVVAVVALVVGTCQFRKTTQLSIDAFKENNKKRIDDTRPSIIPTTSGIALDHDSLKGTIKIKNIGSRSGYDVEIESTIIVTDSGFKVAFPLHHQYDNSGNPFVKDQILDYVFLKKLSRNKEIYKNKMCFMKINLKWTDRIDTSIFKQAYTFYSVSAIDKPFKEVGLHTSSLFQLLKVDSLVKSLTREQIN